MAGFLFVADKLSVVAVRLLVPRREGEHDVVRPFDLTASDIDVLLELKPEGKVDAFRPCVKFKGLPIVYRMRLSLQLVSWTSVYTIQRRRAEIASSRSQRLAPW